MSFSNVTLLLFDGAENKHGLLVKIASVREVVMGAPLRVMLKRLASRSVPSNAGMLVPLVHRPNESFFLVPQVEKVTVVFPMRFSDSIDTVLATSFLQEFVEARRTAGLNNAPVCLWSSCPPNELKDAPGQALSANAGFVSFVISPRHVEGKKLDKTVWNLSTFHAYVNYHVKLVSLPKLLAQVGLGAGLNRFKENEFGGHGCISDHGGCLAVVIVVSVSVAAAATGRWWQQTMAVGVACPFGSILS
ncbi:hypothetical protein E3N88_24123 [Mikania micrantha]|uniref:Arp2/3 complex 34 kDa subunit n=1 Tax=Mikania micrantha TaxID=192012 RepID=A0A5N6NF81_9ASTR|nr:hypothetical protein E3N88_24123 [Mikania micrantha]